jgi:hypothetical protein
VYWVDEASPTWHADAAVSPALVNAGALVLAGVALALVDVRLAARPRKPLRNTAQIYIHTYGTYITVKGTGWLLLTCLVRFWPRQGSRLVLEFFYTSWLIMFVAQLSEAYCRYDFVLRQN